MVSKRTSYWGALLLLFLIVVVAAHSIFSWYRPDPPSDFSRVHANEVARFDCFSPPAVASAILQHEAQYYVNLAVASTEGSAQIASALRGIRELSKQLAELNRDLNHCPTLALDASHDPRR